MPEENELFYRSFEINNRKIDQEKREMEISFSSDIELERQHPMGGKYIEILSHRKEAVNIERLNTVASFVYHHGREIIGPIKAAWIDYEKGKGYARVGFDKTDDGEKRWQQVNSKSLRGISFAYNIKQFRQLNPDEEYDLGTRKIKGNKNIDTFVAERWDAYDITATPIPADHTVGFGRALTRSLKGIKIIQSNKEDKQMGEITQEIKTEIKDAINEALPGIISQVHEQLKEDQRPQLRVNTDVFKDLANRAAAISSEAMNEVTNQLLAGKTEPEVLRFINDKIIENAGTQINSNDGDDGTGRHINDSGDPSKRTFKNVTDEEFFNSLKNPIPFAVN